MEEEEENLLGHVTKEKEIKSKKVKVKFLSKEEIIRRVESPDTENKALFKLCLAFLYFAFSTFVASYTMVHIVNRESLLGIQKYPRLPDLLLDAIPMVDHAFKISELIAITMVLLWIGLLAFHKNKIVILRRMFSLFGSVFFLRSFTMLITSLSVPRAYPNCSIQDVPKSGSQLLQAFHIWINLGMSIQGTTTCSDYMFSGHVATLTLINFCITEYAPSNWRLIHVLSWTLNLSGIYFILAGHEHYSVDVFLAFFISSRMFLSYHTHAYNHAKLAKNDWRVRVWYPLSWAFEAGSTGKLTNEYTMPIWIYGKDKIQIKLIGNGSETMTAIESGAQSIITVGRSISKKEENGNCRIKITMLNKDELIRRVESPDTRMKSLFKLGVSFIYCQLILLLTAFVMVVVDTRVPDMKQYPPLPDLVLSNLPLIPWAFELCELIIVSMALFLLVVIVFHKHRFIILRRMFTLGGTVFLIRCLTMLVTSLSVPGIHLECQAGRYNTLSEQFKRAINIWLHMGMSIQGVRTCGDYMFSGHTATLTLLNFFISEYTPQDWHMVHTMGWVLNCFGIFFILAAHEHYSIDVFMAFYIASRMFLYYHTNAYSLWSLTTTDWRVRVWFPLGWFFEAGCLGKVENEFDLPWDGILSDNDSFDVKETENLPGSDNSISNRNGAVMSHGMTLRSRSRQIKDQ